MDWPNETNVDFVAAIAAETDRAKSAAASAQALRFMAAAPNIMRSLF